MKSLFPSRLLRIGLVALLLLLVAAAVAQQIPIPKVSVEMGQPKSAGDVSNQLKILALLTVLSVAPAILILTTAFTRIVIILSFVRSALGTPSIPPNQVIIGLSLFLTLFVMGPTYTRINDEAIKPYMAQKSGMTFETAVTKAEVPLREFMLKNTYEKDLILFLNIRHERPNAPSEVNMMTLIPAFIVSELKTSFIVGFYLFIPFMIIDLIVASGLMSMGMMMLPPTSISLPAKLLVFVLADGWGTLVAAILAGYR